MEQVMDNENDLLIRNALSIIIEAQKDQLSLTKALINKINRMDHHTIKQNGFEEMENRVKCCESSLIELVSLTGLLATQLDCIGCSADTVYLTAPKLTKH
ncbi:hypothetical protein [Salisediminibacterium selenitireducens]|uniref:Uncharacterized protein n=1 Tax=Bacillus selenitireducens (strain ATCC 700615 / DSM 15326 / MLS10) TaxID=439292 RepID=D6Y0Y4_BACIE|nr:hypothetical protein [Salisediminibacterium selenitireducens]ADH98588.1 hypothetical protein Bsel_1070 [[Bacillus] selenitireducens MLS10]